MDIVDNWRQFKGYVSRHIGPVSEIARKHRRAVMLVSICMLSLEPTTSITLGNVSMSGLGVTVQPPQTIPLSFVLFIALAYFLLAFWVGVLTESGTDRARAERHAWYEHDPAFDADNPHNDDLEQVIKRGAGAIVYKWNFRRIVWEVFLPTILAVVALVRFVYACSI